MIKLLSGKEYKEYNLRTDFGNKFDFGRAGFVCGSIFYQGAAAFSVSAALHTGLGLAVAFIPECIYNAFSSKISGAVIEPLKCKDGMICDSELAMKIYNRKCNAVLCGSGLGISSQSAFTVSMIAQTDLDVVFDADALSIIAKDKSLFDRKGNTVITPHIAEFARLTDLTVDYVRKNRIKLATEFSMKYNCIVVLKDYVTVIADVKGNAYVLSNPTSALSKAGSGDVLAGMIVSFIAQGYKPVQACKIATTLHNACGHKCSKIYGSAFTQPENLIDSVSGLI